MLKARPGGSGKQQQQHKSRDPLLADPCSSETGLDMDANKPVSLLLTDSYSMFGPKRRREIGSSSAQWSGMDSDHHQNVR